MRKFPVFSVFCLAILSGCDLWNLPLTRSEEEAARMFQIREIYVAELPSPNVFVASDEPWLKTAKEWEDSRLVVYAIDGFDKAYRIYPEQYETVNVLDEPYYQNKLTTVTITLQLLENKDITTDFEITLYPAGEKYYKIEQYVDDEKNRVIAFPSIVSESQLEQGAVTVTLYVYPADGYRIKSGYPILTPPPPTDDGIMLYDDNTFTMVPYDLQIEAEFESTDGKAAKVNGKFYDTLVAAIGDAAGEAAGSPVMITVIDNIAIDATITLESGKHIRLVPEGKDITISRKAITPGFGSLFSVRSGASLTLEGDGKNKLIIDGGKEAWLIATEALVTVDGGTLAIGDGVTLQNNYSTTNGGGVAVNGGALTMTGGTISGNIAGYIGEGGGGGIYNSGSSSMVLTNVAITGNSAISGGGGGIYNSGSSSMVLTNVAITSNSAAYGGGGVCNRDGSSPLLFNVTISGNSAFEDGGGIYNRDGSSPLLINAIISGNSAARYGGGICNHTGSSPVLINATIVGNRASNSGGGISNVGDSSPQIRNSVIWGNRADGVNAGISGGTSTISYSIVQESLFDEKEIWSILGASVIDDGNNPADPGTSPFTGWIAPTVSGWLPTTAGDYSLANGNPAIDAGSNGIYPADADAVAALLPAGVNLSLEAIEGIVEALAKDAGGNTRIQGLRIDMGAYEKEPSSLAAR